MDESGFQPPPVNRTDNRADVSQTTFVHAPQGNEPVNLDMSAFDKQAQDADMQGASSVPVKSDTEIINECLQKHVTFSNVM